MSSEDGTQDKEVVELKDKLSQCRLERERLIKEKKRWTIKEKLLKRGLETVEGKLNTEIEADLNARSEFKKIEVTLWETLETKEKTVRQLDEDLEELFSKLDKISSCSRSANPKLYRLRADLEKTSLQARAEADKLDMLASEMNKKKEELHVFYENHWKNYIDITVDVYTLVRDHFAAYLKSCEDGNELITDFILKLDAAQRENEKSATVDFMSSISAGMLKFFNFFLRKKN